MRIEAEMVVAAAFLPNLLPSARTAMFKLTPSKTIPTTKAPAAVCPARFFWKKRSERWSDRIPGSLKAVTL